jgi:hypothetical protein
VGLWDNNAKLECLVCLMCLCCGHQNYDQKGNSCLSTHTHTPPNCMGQWLDRTSDLQKGVLEVASSIPTFPLVNTRGIVVYSLR